MMTQDGDARHADAVKARCCFGSVVRNRPAQVSRSRWCVAEGEATGGRE